MKGTGGTKPDLAGHGLQGIRFLREPLQVRLPGIGRGFIIGKPVFLPGPFISIPQAVTGNIKKEAEVFFFFGGHHSLSSVITRMGFMINYG
jgi:hypothetical protein